MLSRRAVLVAGLASPGVVLASATARASDTDVPLTASEGALPELFRNLPELAGCRVVDVRPVLLGAVPIVIEGAGQRVQVDICRRGSDGARGVASSRSFEAFVHNGGDGSKETLSDHIRALRALMQELDRREAAGARVPQLLSWAERQRGAPGAIFCIEDAASPGA